VLAQGKLAITGRHAIGEWLPGPHPIADGDDWSLAEAGALIGASILAELIGLAGGVDGLHNNATRRRAQNDSRVPCEDEVSAITGHVPLHAGADGWRVRPDQGNRLPLHVGAHQG